MDKKKSFILALSCKQKEINKGKCVLDFHFLSLSKTKGINERRLFNISPSPVGLGRGFSRAARIIFLDLKTI